ncbi:hypothetical protein BGZ80_004120 [Entomortierella chlamydospora]|uniref:F-box domain-containing protein n=1 Tax=Entomortierella chlamydospora TaxID=101097 RepID=A0A9P6MML5_9FUNG|nr:hypothetical protein BGZ80_004120 [Entomortierella chlamydospora]
MEDSVFDIPLLLDEISHLQFFDAIADANEYKYLFDFHFPNLRSLQWTPRFRGLQPPRSNDFVLDFFRDCPTLQEISFGFKTITPELIATLDKSHLPALRSFSLIGGDDIKDDASVQQLIHACARLESLKIGIERDEDHPEEPNTDLYQERKTIMENMPTTRLRYLSIDLRCPSQEAVTLVPLLRKSPLLQELHIHFSPGNDMSRSIATILRDEGCCPELKTLDIMQVEIMDRELAELINAFTNRACISKNHGSSLTTTTSDKVHRNLRNLRIASKNYGPLTVRSLARNYTQNLVDLNIGQRGCVRLSKFIAIVSNLSGLRKLIVGKIYLVSRIRGGSDALVNTLKTPWVCRDLKYLDFGLAWTRGTYWDDDSGTEDDIIVSDDSDTEDDGKADDDSNTRGDGNTDNGSTDESDAGDFICPAYYKNRALSCFFDRVGELKNLRHLSYDGDYIPLLSLSENENEFSYLDRLRDLKKIQTLHVDRTILGVKEAAWLILHWPNLSHISKLYREHTKRCFHCDEDSSWICKRPLELGEAMAVLKAAKPWIIME